MGGGVIKQPASYFKGSFCREYLPRYPDSAVTGARASGGGFWARRRTRPETESELRFPPLRY